MCSSTKFQRSHPAEKWVLMNYRKGRREEGGGVTEANDQLPRTNHQMVKHKWAVTSLKICSEKSQMETSKVTEGEE